MDVRNRTTPLAIRRLVNLATLLATTLVAVAGPCLGGGKRALANPPVPTDQQDITQTDPVEAAQREGRLLSGTRQLTFEGRRAGEGYFSQDGSQLVFQSEREPGNPFFQIYLLDLESGDTQRISPGHGKTTCGWIHPTGNHILFASTHDDAEAREKQKDEWKLRESGKQRRYAWDYDEHFDLYQFNRASGAYVNLTNTRGYDAEGSWSPDGKRVVFTSNRIAYEGGLTDQQQKSFDIDPATWNDIYLMQADGSAVQRLTSTPGYDGGPFFSPDGQRICWRRFSPDGSLAEIWAMRLDGSDQHPLTRLGAMSWAPFYHPSGDYLIFTTNRHGFANFELYLIDTAGKSTPVRVTHTKGFDGLPVFTPDGNRLAWTTNRTSNKQSQIFISDWNHEQALRSLGLSGTAEDKGTASAQEVAAAARQQSHANFSQQDIIRHVDYLCRDELGGRLTGTEGERLATAYVAAYLDSLDLVPAGDDGSWFQPFEFTSGVVLGKANALSDSRAEYSVDRDWRPLSFSRIGDVELASVVFAGYGMVVPEDLDQPEYDSYVHLDVKDKWVLVLRYMPENISAERRQHLSRPSQLRFKTMLARDRGARGLIIASGPNTQVNRRLIPLRSDGTLSGSSLPVISVTDQLADGWIAASGKSLKSLQDKLDNGQQMMGFELDGVQLTAKIDIQHIKSTGRNVLGRLQAGSEPTDQAIVIGAHVDHLGRGASSSSLARDDERQAIHYGADDNASGVAAMLEVAEYLADQHAHGKMKLRRDILFAAWSGEELGLIGSNHFVNTLGGIHAAEKENQKHPHHRHHSIYPAIAACINMDMVGRLNKKLILQGVGSSSIWRGEIERRNVPVGLPIALQEDSYLPTDASSFYMHGVPVLSAFTGSHSEYHTPRDTPDTLNFEGTARVARLMGMITRSLAMRDTPPDYIAQSHPNQGRARARLRAYLGTIPDYAAEVQGVKLGGATRNGPAARAGIQAADVIVELAGRKIENIYDYTFAIEALKIGQKVKIVVERDGKRITLDIVPGSRE